jgi:hypothetical protein
MGLSHHKYELYIPFEHGCVLNFKICSQSFSLLVISQQLKLIPKNTIPSLWAGILGSLFYWENP